MVKEGKNAYRKAMLIQTGFQQTQISVASLVQYIYIYFFKSTRYVELPDSWKKVVIIIFSLAFLNMIPSPLVLVSSILKVPRKFIK